jgi:hypothetical protein
MANPASFSGEDRWTMRVGVKGTTAGSASLRAFGEGTACGTKGVIPVGIRFQGLPPDDSDRAAWWVFFLFLSSGKGREKDKGGPFMDLLVRKLLGLLCKRQLAYKESCWGKPSRYYETLKADFSYKFRQATSQSLGALPASFCRLLLLGSRGQGTFIAGLLLLLACFQAPKVLGQGASPGGLALPEHAVVVAVGYARGHQVYLGRLQVNGSLSWELAGPEATLWDSAGKPFAIHRKGPTWDTRDGTRLVGQLPPLWSYQPPGSQKGDLPWILVRVRALGASGSSSRVNYVARVATHGGGPPKRPPVRPGERLRVPYKAVYLFLQSP